MQHDSRAAFGLALRVIERDRTLTSDVPIVVPLRDVDDVREVAYLAYELQYASELEVAVRICRWLRHREAPCTTT